eukprot:TRINITY_DN22328_c0_g1_i2.p1 TRINITY_DN22328_c0_g1~~TRINITY_DN22328_c0_g1_i2.p1  ORF type:complete len:317 (-),score=63.01 TRINITY_DN22328_c0_g1_i2:51-1001(-)
MLAGWFRLKFPHLVHAAVSSSAPAMMYVDFQGYNDVVAQSTGAEIIGGSERCVSIVRDGHEIVRNMLKSSEGRSSLAELFNVCGGGKALEDENNQADWAGNGVVYLPIQDNDPTCAEEVCNVEKICKFLMDSASAANGSALIALAKLSEKQFGSSGCVSVDHNAYMDSLLNTTIEGGVNRIWLYQTCTEFAGYMTCEVGSQCIYSQGLNTIDKQLAICEQAFQIPATQVSKRVHFTNLYWGNLSPEGSRVIYVNGEIDPFHALAILKSPGPELPAIWVPGASHHFWTHPSLPTDSQFVKQTRQQIWRTVLQWLSEK